MSARKGIYVSIKEGCDPGQSPNAYVGYVTAEIRLFFPPRQREAAEQALMKAVAEAWERFEEDQ